MMILDIISSKKKDCAKAIHYLQLCSILPEICLQYLLNGQKPMVKFLGLCHILWMMGCPSYNMGTKQFFIDHDLDKAKNLKLLFEELSGLKINFHKSELFCFGEAQTNEAQYAAFFGCARAEFPICYLGIPIHYRRLTIAEWRQVEERIQ